MFVDKYSNKFGNCVVPDLLSNNSSENGISFCNGVHSGGLCYDAWRAFSDKDKELSGNQSSWCYAGNHGYIGYIFNNPIIVNMFSLLCTTTQCYIGGFPKDFNFEGSNDGKNYDILYTEKGFNQWEKYNDTEIYFKTTNKKSYKYYRLNILSNDGYKYIQIKRIKFFTNMYILYKYIIFKNNEYYAYNGKNIILLNNGLRINDGMSFDNFINSKYSILINNFNYNIIKGVNTND